MSVVEAVWLVCQIPLAALFALGSDDLIGAALKHALFFLVGTVVIFGTSALGVVGG